MTLAHLDFKRVVNPVLSLGRVWYVWCEKDWRVVTGSWVCSHCGADLRERISER